MPRLLSVALEGFERGREDGEFDLGLGSFAPFAHTLAQGKGEGRQNAEQRHHDQNLHQREGGIPARGPGMEDRRWKMEDVVPDRGTTNVRG